MANKLVGGDTNSKSQGLKRRRVLVRVVLELQSMQGVSGKSGMRRGKNEVDDRGQGPDVDAGNRGGRGTCGGYKKGETMSVYGLFCMYSVI